MKFKTLFLLIILLSYAGTAAVAIPTDITVRVKSKDAKFVGSSMGGMLVVIEDAITGELLAKGITTGSTGDTRIMMKTPHDRGMRLSDETSAKLTVTIDIDEPRYIEVSAYGPNAQLQAANRVSATQWIVPGKHITGGDAWLLEVPGLVVDILAPPAAVKYNSTPVTVELRANVTMMCGCPIEPGGLWDAEKFEVVALLERDGEPAEKVALEYGGKPSQFQAALSIEEKGTYEIIIYAYDPANGNTGLDRASFAVK